MAKQRLKKPIEGTASKNEPKVDYEQIGKMVQNIYESGYIDRNTMYKMSFIKGILAGLGGVVGATLLVTILLWLLSVLHYVPFLNQITDNVQCSISQTEAQPATSSERCDN